MKDFFDMKKPYPGHKVKSDNHPISIFYRGQRRVRMIFERRWPKLWISRLMALYVGSTVKTKTSINERLKRFAANSPFAKVDFAVLFSLEKQKLIKKMSDDILHHQFDLLGSGPVFLGQRISWHSDFVSGFTWEPSRLYSEISKLTPQRSDIKRPWELSRCQHFIPLGLTWRLSNRKEYLDEFVSEIKDWIDQNSVGFGVNWVCPMDAAIRAVNWLAGYSLFGSALSSAKYHEFRKELTASLWEHARFIKTHLEWNGPVSERRANHFLANLCGLCTLGIFFIDTNSGQRWLNFSHKWLEKEIRRQVLEDGVHFECATSYHRLCLEMFLWCYHLSAHNDIPLSGGFKKRLSRMQAYCSAYTRPDGLAPLFGDNDDGRLLFSNLGRINDHRYLWNRAVKGDSAVDAALLMGNDRSNMEPISGLRAFGKAGFYVFQRPDAHLIVRAGRLAHVGDHAHCDQLSFELSIKKIPIFIDRGSYVYTSDLRNRNLYRSTRAHNILSVNGAEQNRSSGEYFGLMDDTQTKVLNANDREIMVRHTGFKTLKRNDISHTRVFRFSEPEKALEIYDFVKGLQNKDMVEWFFHLSPELDAVCFDHTIHVRKGSDLVCEMKIPSGMRMRKERFDNSPSYGRLQEAQTLIFTVVIDRVCSQYKAMYQILWRA